MAGVIASIAEKLNGTKPLDAARRGVEKAAADLAAEVRREAATKEEIGRVTEEIAVLDVDADAKTFAKLVQTRDGARGRLEALEVRRGRAERALEEAKAAFRAAEIADQRQELARLDGEIAERSATLMRTAEEMEGSIGTEQVALRELVQRAQALDAALHAAGDAGRTWHSNSPWLGGGRPLEVAAQVIRSQP